jgi:Rrf2 family protein
LADLAAHWQAGPVPLGQIAARQGISLKYLEQDFSLLRRKGFVRSVKGAQGGYVLDRDPATTTVLEIVRTLEGDQGLVDRLADDDLALATPIRRCLEAIVWQPLNEQIDQTLAVITLQDLLQADLLGDDTEPMYYI